MAPGTSESVVSVSTAPFVCKGRHVADPQTFLASSGDESTTPASPGGSGTPQGLVVVCCHATECKACSLLACLLHSMSR